MKYDSAVFAQDLIVCVTKFDHHFLISRPFVRGVAKLYGWEVFMPHFLLYVYILQVV